MNTNVMINRFQSIHPHITESYGCSNDQSESEAPYCVLKSFPFKSDHAIAWAQAKVQNLLELKPKLYLNFWTDSPDPVEQVKSGKSLFKT